MAQSKIDYYEVLGVERNASSSDIKKAYRDLAKTCHPDTHPNDAEAESRFKMLNEANQILSNSVSRERYDLGLKFTTTTSTKRETFISDLFGNFANHEDSAPKKIKGSDIHQTIRITIQEAVKGCSKSIVVVRRVVCPDCKDSSNSAGCLKCGGEGLIRRKSSVEAVVPPGSKNNAKYVLRGAGNKGLNGGANGDIILCVNIVGDDEMRVDGDNILSTQRISVWDAILGRSVKVTTVKGVVDVKLEPGTEDGTTSSIKGYGITSKGDHIVTFKVEIPAVTTSSQISAVEACERALDGQASPLNFEKPSEFCHLFNKSK